MNSDSESDAELARVGGESVGLDGVQPVGESESEPELQLLEADERLLEKLVKANMVIMGLLVLDVLMEYIVMRELGLCRLLRG